MDLSKFRKVSSDDKTSTFRHYEGHEIKVAHGKLSSKLRDQLNKMPLHKSKDRPHKYADGGDVQMDDQQAAYQNAYPPSEPSAPIPIPDDPVGAAYATAANESNSPTPQAPQPAAMPDNSAPAGPATMNQPVNPDPYGTMGALNQQMAGAKEEGAGKQAEARALGAAGAQNVAQEQAYQKNIEANANAYNTAIAPYMKERAALTSDINNGHINPRKYMDSMSTGGKLATGIGLILGGMGAGLTHGPNLAFKGLQDNIERDIQAQRDELGKKQNLLAHNLRATGDLREAYGLTKMQTNDMLASHLRQTAAETADPIAQARVMQIAGMTDQSTAQLMHQMATTRLQQQAMGGGDGSGVNPVMAIKMLAPAGQQEALMKDLKAKRDTDANIQNMLGAFDNVAQKNTIMNKLNPQAQSQIDADWDPKMVKLAHESAGRFNLEELPIMNKYKPNALDTANTIAQKRQDFLSDMSSRSSFPSLEPYGIKSGGAQAPAQGAGNFGFKPRKK